MEKKIISHDPAQLQKEANAFNAQKIADAIMMNCAAYFGSQITHDQFCAKQKELWVRAQTLKLSDLVRALVTPKL